MIVYYSAADHTHDKPACKVLFGLAVMLSYERIQRRPGVKDSFEKVVKSRAKQRGKK